MQPIWVQPEAAPYLQAYWLVSGVLVKLWLLWLKKRALTYKCFPARTQFGTGRLLKQTKLQVNLKKNKRQTELFLEALRKC